MGEGTHAVFAPARGVRDLGFQHVGHEIRHGPHALADLGMPAQAAGQPDVDILPFIGIQPDGFLQIGLARCDAGLHRGVDLIAGAVEKTGVDERDPRARGTDALGEIDAGAPFLVHDADLHRISRQTEQFFDSPEQLVGKSDLFRSRAT